MLPLSALAAVNRRRECLLGMLCLYIHIHSSTSKYMALRSWTNLLIILSEIKVVEERHSRVSQERVTSPQNSTPRRFPSHIFLTLLLYFLYNFYLSRCTLLEFHSVYYLASLPFFCCCHRTTTIGTLNFKVWKKGYFSLAPSATILSEHLPQHGIRSPYNLPAFGPKVLSFRLPQPLQYLHSEIATWYDICLLHSGECSKQTCIREWPDDLPADNSPADVSPADNSPKIVPQRLG